jgi:hypothetical protein
MNRHKFSVIHWAYDNTTSQFTVSFAVANQETEHVEFHKIPIPYSFEDSVEYMQKVRGVITMYVIQLRRLEQTKMRLMDLNWVSEVPPALIDITINQE